jgi:O-acetyl-ADP-ribose deacetylase (regulator of RNase III)
MPLQMVRNDITKMDVDAIVNAANSTLLGGGGVDGAIHRAAGPELLKECKTLGGCKTGDAKITKGYRLPAKYIIHTVGPVWDGGSHGEKELLASCYRRSLEVARDNGCESVAFPLISAGVFGYPKDQAMRVALDTISEFLMDSDMMVYMVIYGKASLEIGSKLYADIEQYIDDNYVQEHTDSADVQRSRFDEARRQKWLQGGAHRFGMMVSPALSRVKEEDGEVLQSLYESVYDECIGSVPEEDKKTTSKTAGSKTTQAKRIEVSLEETLQHPDESFTEMLLRKIDESGMSDAECYRRANIDRKLFSKIRSDSLYRPSKPTAVAFAIALRLSMEETQELLMKAGYALSPSYKFDLIVKFFIERGRYNVFEINEALFAYDQNMIGNVV